MSERTVWAVKYGNYEPAEVVALYEDKIDAQTEATRRNHEANTGMWEVGSFTLHDGAGRAVQDDGLPTVEELARAFHVLAAKHTGLEESDYDDEDYAYFRQQAEETLEALRAGPPLHDPQEPERP